LSLESLEALLDIPASELGDSGASLVGSDGLSDDMLTESLDGDGSVGLVLDSPRGLLVEIRNSRGIDVGNSLEVEVSEESEGSLGEKQRRR